MNQADVLVVGSGASGVHFARKALALGLRVQMVDVGIKKPKPVLPESNFLELKQRLGDSHDYFLGSQNEALILPENDDEYYGFPPSKAFVFENPDAQDVQTRGFAPLFSYARGGLAEAWTGGSYPFNAEELSGFPFSFEELIPFYDEIAREVGICGAEDDLAQVMPFHEGISEPVALDEHGDKLLATYAKKKERLNRTGFVMGRARLAVLTKDRGDRKACSQLDRCLWGCPTGSIYTPSWTLLDLEKHPNFDYVDGVKVSHFELENDRITGVRVTSLDGGDEQTLACQKLVLAAGTLESARIYLRSFVRDGEPAPELAGLMDNRQVLMPFVNFGLLGRKWQVKNYQYHQLAMGLDPESGMDYIHGLVTTLKSALIHPVIQSLPFSLGTSARFFREMHASLGLVNINFADTPRETNKVSLQGERKDEQLVIHYEPDKNESERIRLACKRFRSALRTLGCLAPKGMTHMRPMGASVHYAGTLPMSQEGDSKTLSPNGRSRQFENLWFVDGTGLSELPAKNLTFTLMANASRIAEKEFA